MKSDCEIRHEIEQELLWDPSVDARYIKVRVHQRVATLQGSVQSCAQKLAARAAAQRVVDCVLVLLELVVRAPAPTSSKDEELANAVSSTLNWQDALPLGAVHAVVKHGWVTIAGEVDNGRQREEAEAVVSRMRGVVGVENRITVREHPLKSDVQAQIAAALARCGQAGIAGIHIEDRDGVVRLTGSVGSVAEKEETTKAAWSTHGVRWVVDQLDVM